MLKLWTETEGHKSEEIVKELQKLREKESTLLNNEPYKYLLRVGECGVSFWTHDSMDPSHINFYIASLNLEGPINFEVSDDYNELLKRFNQLKLVHKLTNFGWFEQTDSFQPWLHGKSTLIAECKQDRELYSFANFLIKTHHHLSIETLNISINLQKIETPQ